MREFQLPLIINELNKRQSGGKFEIEKYCFKEQLDFIKDPSPFKTAVCSRRAGKTISDACYLIDTALKHSEGICLYITLTRLNAKKLIWPELLKLNHLFKLGGSINESELSIRFPSGSPIYVSGAKDKAEIEKFRGLAIRLCIIDEAQLFRTYIESLIDDIIAPTLFDYGGTLALTGTPGPIRSGYYYDCSRSKEWSHHEWTLFKNIHLQIKSGKTAQELLERELKRKGVTQGHPTIQREYFGQWINDPDSLVFKYNELINHYSEIPQLAHPWEFIIGVDIGFEDADAIAVIGWNEKLKASYLFEEIIQNKQGITELAVSMEKLIKKYNPIKFVMDTGGLGKKIAEEIRTRYALPIVAAEKVRKIEFVELLNDAMRTQRFFAKRDSRFAQDCMLIEWDTDSMTPEKLKISDSYHSDITDAVLYAFRESMHWLYEPEKPKPRPNTNEWFQREVEQMEEIVQKSLKQDDDIWGDKNDW